MVGKWFTGRFRSRVRIVSVLLACLVVMPSAARAGVYVYSAIDVRDDGNNIYLQAVGSTWSDDPIEGVDVWITLYDPSDNIIAQNYAWNPNGWEVTAYTDEVALSASSPTGTYWAQSFGNSFGGGSGCSGYTPVQISSFLHHYDFTAMGNPNTYTLAPDSQSRMCSHSTLSWDTTSLSGMTDSGLVAHFGATPRGCLSQCTAGISGTVSGPAGSTLGPASCG